MSDVNDIKAGKYEMVAEFWDEQTSKPGEPFDYTRHRKGDVVALNVEDAKRLVTAGAVIVPGSIQRAQANAASAMLMQALRTLSDEERAQVLTDLANAGFSSPMVVVVGDTSAAPTVSDPDSTGGSPPSAPEPKRPTKGDPKPDWVSYAVASGMNPADADAATKDDLIARYGD